MSWRFVLSDKQHNELHLGLRSDIFKDDSDPSVLGYIFENGHYVRIIVNFIHEHSDGEGEGTKTEDSIQPQPIQPSATEVTEIPEPTQDEENLREATQTNCRQYENAEDLHEATQTNCRQYENEEDLHEATQTNCRQYENEEDLHEATQTNCRQYENAEDQHEKMTRKLQMNYRHTSKTRR